MSKIETRRRANLLTIRDACLPERNDLNWKAGYLAGVFDTDGCYSGKNLRFSQTKNNGLLDAIHRYGTDLGFRLRREDFRSTNGRSERLVGRIEDKIMFLSSIRAALCRKASDFYGRRFPGKQGAKVDGIRRVGIRDLVDIQTTSGTFIAAGVATHNCYAERMAKRLQAMRVPQYADGFKLTLQRQALGLPYKWKKPRTIFVNSMSDLFHKNVPVEFIEEVFQVMNDCTQHQFQVLTKRPERAVQIADRLRWSPNIWLGTSIEDERVIHRIEPLRKVPAAIRFLSLEPLLGPLNDLELDDIHWVIVGGESGPKARPMDRKWVLDIKGQCKAQNVPFFFKQWGGKNKKKAGRQLEGRTWDEMPGDSYPNLDKTVRVA